MKRFIATSLVALGALAPAQADIGLKIVTEKGFVGFVIGDDWATVSLQTNAPVSTAVYQIPNPADAGTPESTNIVLMLYDLTTAKGRDGFAAPLPQYTEKKPDESSIAGWTVFKHTGSQNDVEYVILDARKQDVADVAATVRLAWPHLPGNREGYDAEMEATFRSFLAGVQGHLGPWTPGKDEIRYRQIEQ